MQLQINKIYLNSYGREVKIIREIQVRALGTVFISTYGFGYKPNGEVYFKPSMFNLVSEKNG